MIGGEKNLSQLESLLLLISTLFGLLAAFFLYKMAELVDDRRRKVFKLRLQQSINEKKKQFENFLYDPEMNQLFRDAGYPMGVSLIKYQYFRYISVVTIVLLVIVVNLVGGFSMKGFIMGISGSVFLFIASHPEKVFPIGFVLTNITILRTANKNRELFMLYSMVADEIQTSKAEARNMYNLLLSLREYFDLIKPALDLALANWRKDSHEAFDILAKEIGTPEASQFVKLLQDIGQSDADKALQLIQDRQTTFMNAQRENKRRRLKVYGYMGYAVAFLPLVCYGLNALTLTQMETNYLTDLSNHYKR